MQLTNRQANVLRNIAIRNEGLAVLGGDVLAKKELHQLGLIEKTPDQNRFVATQNGRDLASAPDGTNFLRVDKRSIIMHTPLLPEERQQVQQADELVRKDALIASQQLANNTLAERIRELTSERDELRRGRDQLLEQEKVLKEKLRQAENTLSVAKNLLGLGAMAPLSKRPASCRHVDGGVYEYLGIAKGAGTAKGGMFEIYRDPRDDRLYFRTVADFRERMTVVS